MKYKNTFHLFHFVMTCVTGGAWIIVWLLCGLSNAAHNQKVDRWARANQNASPVAPTIVYITVDKDGRHV